MAEAKKELKKTKKEEVAEAKASTKEVKDGAVKENSKPAPKTAEKPAKEVKTAKAGKRSEKGAKEAEEKAAKLEAQKHRDEDKAEEKAAKPKQVQNVRTRLERRAKGFRKSSELIETDKQYGLTEALDLAVKTSHVKFDATVELHIRLGVDPRQADQNLRDTIVLPAGTGKSVKVAVFADADGVAAAKKAGADIAGEDEFLQQLDKGTINFDVLISTPQQMAKLGKYARLLGPKGLMPNPKSGTVSTDVAKAVTEAKAGRVEYRVDSTGIIHLGIGKVSFGKDKLSENARAVLASVKANKPSSIKGTYVKSIFVASSMGPSIQVPTSEL